MIDIYGGTDPRDIPAYSISDAARYLDIPAGTIRSWTVGQHYPTANGPKFFNHLVETNAGKPRLLSFTNLVEVHMLRAIRNQHKIQLDKVRNALNFIEEEFSVPHPLARERFATDGIDLFVDRYGSLINASSKVKEELKDALATHLERIEPDDTGLAIELYPFIQSSEKSNSRLLVINPRIAFGRPVIAGTGITVSVLAERERAGDSIEKLAKDYNCEPIKIEEAIRFQEDRISKRNAA